nr:chorismate-binding protein [uncultured Psychroserpens sp.]
MLKDVFFTHIESQHKSQLPFVAYRKPNETIVKAVLQNDTELHIVDDFTESGFIYAPYDSENDTIIFPSEMSKTLTSEIKVSSDTKLKKTLESDTENPHEQYIELVQKGIESIINNQFKKVVLSRVEAVTISEVNPIAIFKSLLNRYQTAFVYIWYHPKVGLWLGATPETLLHIEGQRFKTMALAGTQPYVNTTKVEWDIKNIEEQQVVTDFIKKELAPYTNELITMPAQTIKAGQLLHLQSKISGTLRVKRLRDIIFALHPTPAVCGLPKKEAKDFIKFNENYDREFYTGFLGELNIKTSKTRNTNRRNVENNAYATVKNSSQLYVNLRCMQIKNQQALIYVGGGITKDSKPQLEWEETVNKKQTIGSVL